MNIEDLYVWGIYSLSIIIQAYIWGQIFGWKYNGKHKQCVHGAGVILWIFLMWLVRTQIPDIKFIRFLCTFGIMWSFQILPYKGTLGKRILLTSANVLMMSLLEIGTWFLLPVLGIERSEFWQTYSAYATSLYYMFSFIYIMAIAGIVYLNKKYMKRQLLFGMIPFYQLVLALLFIKSNVYSVEQVMLLGSVTIIFDFLLDIGAVWFLSSSIRRLETEEKLAVLYKQRLYELEYYQSINHYMEEVRKIRHDFMNQIQTIYLLLKRTSKEERTNCYESRKQCSENTKKVVEQYGQNIFCDNFVLDAVLSIKERKAETCGISFLTECHMGNLSRLNGVEICSLFGNLLDNAVEACNSIPPQKAFILLRVEESKDKLYICCENSVDWMQKTKDGFWNSKKEDKKRHGLGLKILEKLIEQHNGCMKKSVQGDRVRIEINL